MNTSTSTAAAETVRFRDTLRDNGLATMAMVLVVAVSVSGWSASFISLHGFAVAHMTLTERAAWLVPATFDGAALGLSLLSFRAAIYGRPSLGSALWVYGFTALSSWINWIHITDRSGKFVACLLPVAAVLVFGKVLKEAREAFERRNGKQVFRVRPGLLVLRWMADRAGTRAAIRGRILDIPVEALIGLGTESLARQARESLSSDVKADITEQDEAEGVPNLGTTSDQNGPVLNILSPFRRPFPSQDKPFSAPVNTLPSPQSASPVEQARELHLQGLSYQQIGDRLGMSKTWAFNAVNAQDLTAVNGHGG